MSVDERELEALLLKANSDYYMDRDELSQLGGYLSEKLEAAYDRRLAILDIMVDTRLHAGMAEESGSLREEEAIYSLVLDLAGDYLDIWRKDGSPPIMSWDIHALLVSVILMAAWCLAVVDRHLEYEEPIPSSILSRVRDNIPNCPDEIWELVSSRLADEIGRKTVICDLRDLKVQFG